MELNKEMFLKTELNDEIYYAVKNLYIAKKEYNLAKDILAINIKNDGINYDNSYMMFWYSNCEKESSKIEFICLMLQQLFNEKYEFVINEQFHGLKNDKGDWWVKIKNN